MSVDIISPKPEYREQDCEKFLLIKTNTALEAGKSQVLGMPRPMGTPRAGDVPGAKRNFRITRQRVTNMPYYTSKLNRAAQRETEGGRGGKI